MTSCSMFRDDLHVECMCCGDASPNAGKYDLMNIGDFNEALVVLR